MHQSADVLVIGAGPAGIAAAVSAAESGMSVLVVDESAAPGGQIWRGAAASSEARKWQGHFSASGARFIGSTTVVAATSPRSFIAERNGEPLRLGAARAVILATGARELFLPFRGWTLPGVIGVGGAQALLKRGWNVAGQRVVVAGTGPLLLAVATALRQAGAAVQMLVEQTSPGQLRRFARSLWRSPTRAIAGARYRWSIRTAPYLTGSWVASAEGDSRLRRVRIEGLHERTVACEVLCVGYGLVGSTELPRLLGCAVTARGVTVDELQRTTIDDVYCAGETVAIGGVEAALVQGRIAGLAAAGRARAAARHFRERSRHTAFGARLRVAFAVRPEISRLGDEQTIVCRCEDVRWDDISRCESMREARLHTRVGMGACQGRVCGAALRHLKGWSHDTVRTPLAPARISTLIHAARTDDNDAEG